MPGDKSNLLHLHSHPIHSMHSYTLKPAGTGPAQPGHPKQLPCRKSTTVVSKAGLSCRRAEMLCYRKSITLNHVQELVHAKMHQVITKACNKDSNLIIKPLRCIPKRCLDFQLQLLKLKYVLHPGSHFRLLKMSVTLYYCRITISQPDVFQLSYA